MHGVAASLMWPSATASSGKLRRRTVNEIGQVIPYNRPILGSLQAGDHAPMLLAEATGGQSSTRAIPCKV